MRTPLVEPSADGTAALALAVHRREHGAFDSFVQAWERPLFEYACRLLQNSFDAQEVVQDALMRAHRALTRQYDEDRCRALAVRPWLFRIARNLSLNRRRGVWSKIEQPLSAFDDDRIGAFADGRQAGAELEQAQQLARLERALEKLPTEGRELVVLRFIEEMSYAEIAKTTGLSETQLRGRVFRALKLLRTALEKEGASHAL
ncbi:MAG: RNA polymerase sigma factor [Thermoanaerobaculia bacterium]